MLADDKDAAAFAAELLVVACSSQNCAQSEYLSVCLSVDTLFSTTAGAETLLQRFLSVLRLTGRTGSTQTGVQVNSGCMYLYVSVSVSVHWNQHKENGQRK